jgi:hypothetical protein
VKQKYELPYSDGEIESFNLLGCGRKMVKTGKVVSQLVTPRAPSNSEKKQ